MDALVREAGFTKTAQWPDDFGILPWRGAQAGGVKKGVGCLRRFAWRRFRPWFFGAYVFTTGSPRRDGFRTWY